MNIKAWEEKLAQKDLLIQAETDPVRRGYLTLDYNLHYIWCSSFSHTEELKNGTVLAYFNRYYRPDMTKNGTHYLLKVRFVRLPHNLVKDWGQYWVDEISFGGVRLPLEYKQEVKQQMLNLLRKYGYIEKKRRNV